MEQDRNTVVVDVVRRVEPDRLHARSGRPQLNISFGEGAVAHLDPADPREQVWAEVLESLRESKQPAYVELNPATRRIVALLLPSAHRVLGIEGMERDTDLRIELEDSQAVHHLRRRHPRFQQFRELLVEALRSTRQLLVTNSLDSSEIVDVRPAPQGRK